MGDGPRVELLVPLGFRMGSFKSPEFRVSGEFAMWCARGIARRRPLPEQAHEEELASERPDEPQAPEEVPQTPRPHHLFSLPGHDKSVRLFAGHQPYGRDLR